MNKDEIVEDLFNNLKESSEPFSEGMLIILMGLPYSGKSTISAYLKEKGFSHVWSTIIKKKYGVNNAEMLEISLEVSKKLLQLNYRVTFDFVNHTEALRKPFIKLAEQLGVKYRILFIDTNKDILIERQEKTAVEGGSEGRSLISKEVINTVSNELELPIKDEHLISVGNGDKSELDRWLSAIELPDS